MLDMDLIHRFRDSVNANGFTLFKYRNNHNKNQWSCICSAMDWITVAVEHLNKCPLGSIRSLSSLEMYSYIASCDIIVEAIQQLHRVIFSTKTTIFEKDCNCFPDNQFNQTDLIYFKTIRACFGAHPVNLNEPGDEENKAMRRFASWSGGSWSEGDFSVFLYSNQLEEDNIHLSIRFKQIIGFVRKHYNYLEVLIEELNRQYDDFCSKMRKLRFACEGTPIERLLILQHESKLRLNKDYYRYAIDELLLIFSTPISAQENFKLVEEYRNALTDLIDEMYHNLQEMSFDNLENDMLLYPQSNGLPNDWGYWYEKLSENVFGNGYPPELWRPRIEDIFAGKFQFSYKSPQELFILVKAAVYRMSKQEGLI